MQDAAAGPTVFYSPHGEHAVEYQRNVKDIRPTERWDSGKRETLLIITTDLALPSSPDYDEEAFAELEMWTRKYRDERYPGLEIRYRND
jgi:hypothetical protein